MNSCLRTCFAGLLLAGCACLSAGDVQVDTNGNLLVGADPLPVNGPEIVRTQGVIRAGNVLSGQSPVNVNPPPATPVTLQVDAFGKWHLISGTNSNADYIINLPAASGNQGKCIGFRVLDATAASKTYTVTATGGAKIDGNTTQALVANGNLVLMSDGTNWARIGGTSTGSGAGGTGVAALTDWQVYTPTISGCGTVVSNTAQWRRIGDTLHVRGTFTAGTTTQAVQFGLSLPPGNVVSVVNGDGGSGTHLVGFLCRSSNGVPHGSLLANPGDTVLGAGAINLATVGALAKQTGANVILAGERVSWEASVPIAGWSGAQVVQQGSRYLWSQRYSATATRVAAVPTALGQYRSRRIGVDTAPTSPPSAADGFRMDAGSGIAAGRINRYDIYVGPNKVVQVMWHRSPGRRDPFNTRYYSAGSIARGVMDGYDPTAGVLSLVCYTDNVADSVGYDPLTTTHYSTGYFDILVADDPVPVALAPAVHVEASSDAGQSVSPNVTDLQWEDEAYDSHSAWSGSVFTAPATGVYLVTAAIGDTTAQATPALWKNGALYVTGTYNYVTSQVATITTSVRLNAGENIRIRSGNAFTRSATVTNNWLRITKIGD